MSEATSSDLQIRPLTLYFQVLEGGKHVICLIKHNVDEDVMYLQTVMRFFRSTATLRADAFFDARPIAIAVWMQPDSIQRRPRGLFGNRAQARTSPSYQHPPWEPRMLRATAGWRRTEGRKVPQIATLASWVVSGKDFQSKIIIACWLHITQGKYSRTKLLFWLFRFNSASTYPLRLQ